MCKHEHVNDSNQFISDNIFWYCTRKRKEKKNTHTHKKTHTHKNSFTSDITNLHTQNIWDIEWSINTVFIVNLITKPNGVLLNAGKTSAWAQSYFILQVHCHFKASLFNKIDRDITPLSTARVCSVSMSLGLL